MVDKSRRRKRLSECIFEVVRFTCARHERYHEEVDKGNVYASEIEINKFL